MRYKNTLLLITIFTLASCRQQKELIYFEGLGESDIQNQTAIEEKEYRIRANDILFIRVLTQDQNINNLFLAAAGSISGTGQTAYSNLSTSEDGMYFNGFSVREDGYVDIPLIGLVEVKGKTIDEAKISIEGKAGEQLKEPIIRVKLANFKVTLLGEVMRPGTYTYFNNQATILEAIAKSGDLTDYGNRQQVLIIRPTVNGSRSYRINLQDKKLLTTPEYYIQPNDVIYVPPLKAKGARMIAGDYGVLISAVSSTLATLSLIITLILNLSK